MSTETAGKIQQFMVKIQAVLLVIPFVFILLVSSETAQGESVSCGYDLGVDRLLAQSDLVSWLYWVEVLSGENPAQLDNFPYIIRTRNTRYMFDGSADGRGYDYVLQQIKNWYPEPLIIEHSYPYGNITAYNLIVTIPGSTMPDEYVHLVAHLDDTSWDSVRIAPGANDNAVGAATLLEAARLFRQLEFKRSVRFVWFTGEEAGTLGSYNYVKDFGDLDYQGVINLDMFGWDGDGDRCFEIHVGGISASNEIGKCLSESIDSYPHNLKYDYLISGATSRSDHFNFWQNDIGAIAIIENASEYGTENGCVGEDMNPYYHTKNDTIALNLTQDYAYDIARAAMEATASLAGPVQGDPISVTPVLEITDAKPGQVTLSWTHIPGADLYRVFRSSFGCQDWGVKIGGTYEPYWTDDTISPDWPYQYRIEAVFEDGIRVSQSSNCVSIGPEPPPEFKASYLPVITR